MADQNLDEIRALIDPNGYLDALRNAHKGLKDSLAACFVQHDLAEASPELTPEQRAAALHHWGGMIRDASWRMQEIGRRIEAARNGAMGQPAPSRAERRRKDKARAGA